MKWKSQWKVNLFVILFAPILLQKRFQVVYPAGSKLVDFVDLRGYLLNLVKALKSLDMIIEYLRKDLEIDWR